MRIVVGLGNPGKKYERTRHNAGFQVVDRFSKENNIELDNNCCRSLIGKGKIDDEDIIVAKPLTYMNNSGEAVRCLLEVFGVSTKNLIVICDDINLPIGKIRIRSKGSCGGNKGLDSIIKTIGTQIFPRIRIGIGPSPSKGDTVDFVLSKFKRSEIRTLKESIIKASEAIECIITEGITSSMNKYNINERAMAGTK